MGVFKYKILTPEGKIESDIIYLPFEEPSSVIRFLERQGGIVLDISRVSLIGEKLFDLFKRTGGIKRSDLAEVFNNLAVLVRAGVTILEALKEVFQDTKDRRLKFLLKSIIADIEMGQTLSEAFERHRGIFSPLIIYMVRIGEETGRLDKMLEKIRDHLLRVDKIISDTKRAIRYPSFLFVMLLGAFSFWFWFVVPKIVNVFKQMGIDLPLPTKIILWLSYFVKFYLPWFLAGLVVSVFVFLLFRKKFEVVRFYSDRILLLLPVISKILNTSIIARLCENLGVLIASGITITKALDIIIATTSNLVYKKRLAETLSLVEAGNSLSRSLSSTKAFTPFVTRMLHVGEETGRLPEQMEYVARVYRARLEELVDLLGKTLEPVLLIIVGAFFALIMVGMLLPVYDLVSKMGI